MRKLVLSCDGSLPTMQNAHRAGWDGVFFEYRDGEQLRTSAAYAARKGLFVQSVHAPFEDIWRLWEDAGEGGEQIGNETTLKTHYPEPEKKCIRLHPENSDMKDFVVRECNIQGVAKHVIKKL